MTGELIGNGVMMHGDYADAVTEGLIIDPELITEMRGDVVINISSTDYTLTTTNRVKEACEQYELGGDDAVQTWLNTWYT